MRFFLPLRRSGGAADFQTLAKLEAACKLAHSAKPKNTDADAAKAKAKDKRREERKADDQRGKKQDGRERSKDHDARGKAFLDAEQVSGKLPSGTKVSIDAEKLVLYHGVRLLRHQT